MPDMNRHGKLLEFKTETTSIGFMTYSYTGSHGSKSHPGVGIRVRHYHERPFAHERIDEQGQKYWDITVDPIDRDQTRALRDHLSEMLSDFPEEETP